jgi:Hemerythrin HHE cation binding domain
MAEPTSIRPDISEMAAVHKVFRASLASAPDLIKRADGDATRRALIANYYANVLAFLEVHHDGEQELLFPLLIERVPEERGKVDLAIEQHHQVLSLLTAAKTSVAAWEENTEGEDGRVVPALGALDEALSAHLDQEETIVPLAGDHVTVEEWGMLPAHAMANFQGDKVWLILGLIRENFTPEQRATMLDHMPPPAREMWETFGESSFSDLIAEVRKTD